MPETPSRRLDIALALCGLLLFVGGCGDGTSGATVAPVEVPADFSQEASVQRLVESKYAAAKAAPGDPASHLSLGLAFVANDGWELGELAFRKALELDPNDAEPRYQLAIALAARGELDAQIQELQTVVGQHASFFPAHFALGCALLDRGDLSGATQSFETVQTGQGPTRMGELGLGLVALERNEPRKALQLLGVAAKKYPRDEFIRFQIGQAYLDLGEEDRAKEILATVKDVGGRPGLRSPGTAESERYAVNRASQVKEALRLIAANRHATAIPMLEKLVDADSTDLAVANNLHVAYLGAGKFEDALRVVDAAIAEGPDQYPAHLNRAVCLLRMAEVTRKAGRTPESIAQLEDALKSSEEAARLAPRYGPSQLQSGQILFALRRNDASIQAFRKGIDLGEVQESTFVDMHQPVLRARGPQAAEELLREGLQHGGARPHIRFLICGILLQSARGPEARAEQRELARVAPGHQYAKRADQILTQSGY